MNFKILTLLPIATGWSLLLAEPSVYGRTYTSGGDASLYSLRQQVASLKEEVEGLKSVVRGLSDRLGRENRSQKSSVDLSEMEELRRRVEKLEKSCVSSSGKEVKKSVKAASPKKNPSTKTVKSAKNSLDKASSSKLYSRGVILFDRKSYAEAKKRFEILVKRNYKPAASNFYMGEIAYRTGRYRDAIKYYQRSAELNENAAYMDRLLLHTGISLENEGDRGQAKKFYQAIVDAYPGTGSAKVAKKRLK